jgi:Arc-like DNA binding domain
MKSVTTDKPSVQAYIRSDLKQLLIEEATKNDRTISSEVADILERYMDQNHYLVRMPDKIREQLETIAKSENRSIENMIEWIIIQFISQRV